MYDAVLVPTDGSDRSERATAHGIALAVEYGATLHALYVVDASAVEVGEFTDAGMVRDALAESGEQATATIAEQARDRGLDAVASVRDGSPARTILDYADEAGIDLVAMGTHGRTGLSRTVLGSVAERVVRTAEVPVLTVHPDGEPDHVDYDAILIPTDGGPESRAATRHGLDLADRFDASVRALSVVDTTLSRNPALLSALREACEQAVRDVAVAGAEMDVPVETDVLEGAPADTIVEYADDWAVDLVVMGTHGRTGLDRFVTRSVAERVVRLSDAPVLAVHGDASEA